MTYHRNILLKDFIIPVCNIKSQCCSNNSPLIEKYMSPTSKCKKNSIHLDDIWHMMKRKKAKDHKKIKRTLKTNDVCTQKKNNNKLDSTDDDGNHDDYSNNRSDSNDDGSDSTDDDSDYNIKSYSKRKKSVSKHKSKKQSRKKEVESKKQSRKKEVGPLSAYEKMLAERQAERLAFLKDIQMNQVKADFTEAASKVVQVKKMTTKAKKTYQKRKVKRIDINRQSQHLSTRKSTRLANFDNKNARNFKVKKVLPSELSLIDALISGNPKEYIKSFHEQETNISTTEFISYDKTIVKNFSPLTGVRSIVFERPSALCWYPSAENLILAVGNSTGFSGIWKVMDSEVEPLLFKIHYSTITNMQFSLFNPAQLISSSLDGTLLCSDLYNHTLTKVYNVSGKSHCTYFDFLSPTTYLVSQSNGQVALVDMRSKGKTSEKRHTCHKYSIKTVDVHPVNKNVFVTASEMAIRIWDLRKLQTKPVVEILHHKKTVNSAFFSPVFGNSILTISLDDTICIFDSTNLTTEMRLKREQQNKIVYGEGKNFLKAKWLPHSDDAFVVGCADKRIRLFDKDMNIYHELVHYWKSAAHVIEFHPFSAALAAGNYKGQFHLFT